MKRFVRNISLVLTKKEKQRFTSLTLLNLVISIADIGSLAMLVYIINFYTRPDAYRLPFFPDWLFNRESVSLILLFLIVFSIKNYAAWQVNRSQYKFMAAVAGRISEARLLNYQSGTYTDYTNIDSAVHIRKISYNPLEFCQHILDGMQQLITQLVLILLTIIAIVAFNAKLFLLLFIILMPPVIGVFYLIKKRLGAVRANTRITSEGSLQHLQEALAGYVESNIYNKNDYFLQRYLTYQHEFNRYIAANLIAQSMPARIIEIFALLGLFMLIAINRWTGNTDSAAIVTVGAFMAAAYKIIPGIVKILNVLGQMNTYSFTLDDLAASIGESDPEKKQVETKKISSLCVKNIHFRYNDQPVLDNVSFHLQRGDFIGISGASGKGKTTILNLLLGFLEPETGEIIINEKNSDKQARQQYWNNIAYVKQQPFMIRDTILQNIVLDAGIIDEQRLQKAIDISGLAEVINKFPEKLDKIVTENGKNISGGQRQRIALARALYKDADLIILDEPFNELDEASEQNILNNLKQFTAGGKMIILITHHSKSLSFCDKTVSLDA